jgi:hypothetical protein
MRPIDFWGGGAVVNQRFNGETSWAATATVVCHIPLCKDVSSQEHEEGPSSGMSRRVALVKTERSATIVSRLLVTAKVVASSPILVTLLIEARRSSETSVVTRATRRNIPGDVILHSHRREDLKSYIALTGICSGDVVCLLRSTNWGFISQKTAFFIVTALNISNLT